MEMHLPGGSSWFDEFFDDGHDAYDGGDQAIVNDVSVEELTEALQAMQRGDVEYVTLVHGDEFAQAAGDGDGPYLLEHNASPRGPVTSVSNAPFDVVTAVLTSYRSGDGAWREMLPAPEPAPAEPDAEGGGLLSRFRRRR
jgi:hypothetical protein